jgi:phosphoribosylamine--glycine ligase
METDWVGKDGLFVFDTIGYGKDQDRLRGLGYWVIGGSYFGDKREEERQLGKKLLSECGVKIAPSANFNKIENAIDFVKNNKGPWVLKQNGHIDKTFNYVGRCEDIKDV